MKDEDEKIVRTTISLMPGDLEELKSLSANKMMSLSAFLVYSILHGNLPKVPISQGLRTFYCRAICKDSKIGSSIVQTFLSLVEVVHTVGFDAKGDRHLLLIGSTKDIMPMLMFAQDIFEKCEVEVLYIR